ncbi:hypothetical protein [Zavarzinella formosa]|uniref:hypothetical protein n=1 Tax=Zavarzinella formosa TaxID=360055 RepID=UPI0012F963B2|nr:hypothetical protein [Zavarzinella formosa]
MNGLEILTFCDSASKCKDNTIALFQKTLETKEIDNRQPSGKYAVTACQVLVISMCHPADGQTPEATFEQNTADRPIGPAGPGTRGLRLFGT